MFKLPSFLVLLVAVFLFTSVFAISSSKSIPGNNSKVLSDKGEGGGDSGGGHSDSGSGGSSGGSNSGSSNTGGLSSQGGGESKNSALQQGPIKIETKKPELKIEIKKAGEIEKPEIENETEVEVREGTEEAKIKIASKEGKFTFSEVKFEVESEFPVTVDKKSHELTITTPAGTKTVTVLPDRAVENMVAQKFIDNLTGGNGQTTKIKIGSDGNLVYEIKGVKNERFLGLIGVAVPRTIDVSTQNGQLLSVNQSPLDRLIELISF